MSDGDLDALRAQRMAQFVSYKLSTQCVLVHEPPLDAPVAKNNHKIRSAIYIFKYIYICVYKRVLMHKTVWQLID